MSKIEIDKNTLKSQILSRMTQDDIAKYWDCSRGTVVNRIKKYGFTKDKLKNEFEPIKTKICKSCNLEKPLNDFEGSLAKCKDCYAIVRKNRHYKRIKLALNVEKLKCSKCGYDKNLAALDYHHIDPNLKDVRISKLRGKSLEFYKEELDKCIILCANCHREHHNPELTQELL